MRVSEAARAACLANNGGQHVQAILNGVGFVGPCLHCERIQAAIDSEARKLSEQWLSRYTKAEAEISELVEALRDTEDMLVAWSGANWPYSYDSDDARAAAKRLGMKSGHEIGERRRALLSRYQDKVTP